MPFADIFLQFKHCDSFCQLFLFIINKD